MMPTALVTGGAGFIGSRLTRKLDEIGYQVSVLDDLSSGVIENLDGSGARLINGDIRSLSTVERAMRGADWVFHQAALVSVPGSIAEPILCYQVNLGGTLNVLETARQMKVGRVVLASSAAVYGNSKTPVSEAEAAQPLSPYAASKLAMEEAAQMYFRVHRLPTVCLRYFNVYGPRQRPDSPYAAVVPAFVRAMINEMPPAIFGDGEQRRDFVHVDDVVRANLLAAERDAAIGQTLNISGGGGVTINELAKNLQAIIPDAPTPVHESPREADINYSEAVTDRAWQALGYRPKVALVDGLRSTVEWFRQERLQIPP